MRRFAVLFVVAWMAACGNGEGTSDPGPVEDPGLVTDDGTPADPGAKTDDGTLTDPGQPQDPGGKTDEGGGADPGTPDAGGGCEVVGTQTLGQECQTACDCEPGEAVFCYGEAYTAPYKICMVDKSQLSACPAGTTYLNLNNSALAKYNLTKKALCMPVCKDVTDCQKIDTLYTYCANGNLGTRWDGATLSMQFTCQVKDMDTP